MDFRFWRKVWLAVVIWALLGVLAAPVVAAPPLPSTDPLGQATLHAADTQGIFDGLRTIIYTLVALLACSMAVNLYLVWLVRGFQENIANLIQGMGNTQQIQVALREVAQYWLERRAERLSREDDDDLHAPSRFEVTHQRPADGDASGA